MKYEEIRCAIQGNTYKLTEKGIAVEDILLNPAELSGILASWFRISVDQKWELREPSGLRVNLSSQCKELTSAFNSAIESQEV